MRAYARRVLEEEELIRARGVERTDLVARLGLALELMGTLIPLGLGLAALGAGNVRGLAEAVAEGLLEALEDAKRKKAVASWRERGWPPWPESPTWWTPYWSLPAGCWWRWSSPGTSIASSSAT